MGLIGYSREAQKTQRYIYYPCAGHIRKVWRVAPLRGRTICIQPGSGVSWGLTWASFTPSEIVAIIEQDVDELLALAGRVLSDLSDIIKNKLRETAALLRTVSGLTAEEVGRLSRNAEKSRGE